MTRIYDDRRPLDYANVEDFFRRRSSRMAETGPLSVTMYQTEDLARRRDEHEKAVVLPQLGVTPLTRVLDVGCGTGRWGVTLFPLVSTYLGTDFNQVFVDAGNRLVTEAGLDNDRFAFQQVDAREIGNAELLQKGAFNLIIIAGVTLFLNDEDVLSLYQSLSELAAPGASIYLREPLGISHRLTLLDDHSTQLDDRYNAVYRTESELLELMEHGFQSRNPTVGFNVALFPPELQTSTARETEQRVFVVRLD